MCLEIDFDEKATRFPDYTEFSLKAHYFISVTESQALCVICKSREFDCKILQRFY